MDALDKLLSRPIPKIIPDRINEVVEKIEQLAANKEVQEEYSKRRVVERELTLERNMRTQAEAALVEANKIIKSLDQTNLLKELNTLKVDIKIAQAENIIAHKEIAQYRLMLDKANSQLSSLKVEVSKPPSSVIVKEAPKPEDKPLRVKFDINRNTYGQIEEVIGREIV